jgi:hypothetical protein
MGVLIQAQVTRRSSDERGRLMETVPSCHGVDRTEDGSKRKFPMGDFKS